MIVLFKLYACLLCCVHASNISYIFCFFLDASNICSRCACSMLAPPRFIGKIPCALFRSGNATTPNLSKLRPIEAIPFSKINTDHIIPPPYHGTNVLGPFLTINNNLTINAEWNDNIFPGAATFDKPFWTSGRLWAYEQNFSIPDSLCVFHDHVATLGVDVDGSKKRFKHFAWVPSVAMLPSEYKKVFS